MPNGQILNLQNLTPSSQRRKNCSRISLESLKSMSFAIDAPNLQIWDNAAFDDALIGGDQATAKAWLPLQPISNNLSLFSNPDPYKEKSSEKSSKKPRKENIRSIPNDDDVDAEIEQVEKEIRRLSLKLEALRIQKAEMEFRASTARRGRIIPAKFMEQKPSPACKNMEESPSSLRRRGFSLGPLEIRGSAGKSCFRKLEGIREETTPSKPPPSVTKAAELRLGHDVVHGLKKDSSGSCYRKRGLSLGPTEIASSSRCHFPNKLQGIKKEKMASLTVSPSSRKPTISTLSSLRKGISTVGSIKSVRKDDSFMGTLKPKTLFHELQNPASGKKPLKNAKVRVVASRYSLAPTRNGETEKKRRKWSLPEPDKRSLSLGESSKASKDQGEGEEENLDPSLIASTPPSIMKIATLLPMISTIRSTGESPRDSGCAKRVAHLLGKKSHFSREEGEE